MSAMKNRNVSMDGDQALFCSYQHNLRQIGNTTREIAIDLSILIKKDVVEDLMVKLDELILTSSVKGSLVDHPEDYSSGLFLLTSNMPTITAIVF